MKSYETNQDFLGTCEADPTGRCRCGAHETDEDLVHRQNSTPYRNIALRVVSDDPFTPCPYDVNPPHVGAGVEPAGLSYFFWDFVWAGP